MSDNAFSREEAGFLISKIFTGILDGFGIKYEKLKKVRIEFEPADPKSKDAVEINFKEITKKDQESPNS